MPPKFFQYMSGTSCASLLHTLSGQVSSPGRHGHTLCALPVKSTAIHLVMTRNFPLMYILLCMALTPLCRLEGSRQRLCNLLG